jgi:hypothetical protein
MPKYWSDIRNVMSISNHKYDENGIVVTRIDNVTKVSGNPATSEDA